jgi:hypothetical protein
MAPAEIPPSRTIKIVIVFLFINDFMLFLKF